MTDHDIWFASDPTLLQSLEQFDEDRPTREFGLPVSSSFRIGCSHFQSYEAANLARITLCKAGPCFSVVYYTDPPRNSNGDLPIGFMYGYPVYLETNS